MAARRNIGVGDGYDHSTHVKMDGGILLCEKVPRNRLSEFGFQNELTRGRFTCYAYFLCCLCFSKKINFIKMFILNFEGREKKRKERGIINKFLFKLPISYNYNFFFLLRK